MPGSRAQKLSPNLYRCLEGLEAKKMGIYICRDFFTLFDHFSQGFNLRHCLGTFSLRVWPDFSFSKNQAKLFLSASSSPPEADRIRRAGERSISVKL